MADKVDGAWKMAEAAEDKLRMIKESLQHYDTQGLKMLILEEKLSEKSIYMDITTEICQYITQVGTHLYSQKYSQILF